MNITAYSDFIRYALTPDATIPDSCSQIDWMDFLQFCDRQGVSGVVFAGIEKADLRIGSDAFLEWLSVVESVRQFNWIVNKGTLKVSKFFESRGIRSCILKGQSNGLMYPNPERRTPGDIDIWVDGEDTEIIRTVRSVAPDAHYEFHHVEMPIFEDLSVEVHYRPAYMSNWWKDKQLSSYIRTIENNQFENHVKFGEGEIGCLTDDFNALFQMVHMYGHFFSSRNNLKQLIDYFYLLKRNITSEQREMIVHQFRKLGMIKYAQGIMWIEHKVLGLDGNYLLLEPDEKIGRVLWQETMHYGEKKHLNNVSVLVGRITDNLHLFWHFPVPVLIAPVYLIWHQWWKLTTFIRLKFPSH